MTTTMRRPVTTAALAAAIAAAVIAAPTAARADELQVDLKVRVAPKEQPLLPGAAPAPTTAPTSGEEIDGRPFFRATVLSRPGLRSKDFILRQNDVKPPLTIEASKAVVYRESDEPMSMLILVQGNFRWMGNEAYTDPNDPAAGGIYEGAHRGLGPAIDILVKAGPPGSKAGLLVFAEGSVTVKQALGDATSLTGAALGAQQDYGEFTSQPLIVGLTEAWKILANEAGRRKILVIFGDGMDDKEDMSVELKKALADLKSAEIEAYGIYYTAVPDDGPQGQQNMQKIGYDRAYTATQRDNFATFAGNIVELIGSKYYVDFPGEKAVFDGAEHEFVVAVAGQDSDPKMLTLPVIKQPKADEGSLWWLWLILGLVLVIAIVVIVVVIRRRRVEVYEPPPVVDLPPASPMKTIMLGVGGEKDSIPLVGWIVPLGGATKYQTFKLMPGATKLGSGGASHVVVGDSFMSTEHAEIVASPTGFVLNDLGSTNGSFKLVQGEFRRITTHELLDNDVFKLGKTDFKFKSIN